MSNRIGPRKRKGPKRPRGDHAMFLNSSPSPGTIAATEKGLFRGVSDQGRPCSAPGCAIRAEPGSTLCVWHRPK